VLLARVASGAADGFLPVTLSFAVLRVTGPASRLGLVLATQAAAALLVTLAGGMAGDRFPRARVMAVSLLARDGLRVAAAVAGHGRAAVAAAAVGRLWLGRPAPYSLLPCVLSSPGAVSTTRDGCPPTSRWPPGSS